MPSRRFRAAVRPLIPLSRLAALSLFAGWVLLAAPAPPAAASPPVKLTPQQQREVNGIVGRFKLNRRDMAERQAAVRDALQYGPAAVEPMHAAIGAELHPQLGKYGEAFFRAASGLAAERLAALEPGEVSELQAKVLGLRERDDFSKELIVREGEPALRRLEELFLVDRGAVLERSAALGPARERLFELGRLWEQTARHLAAAAGGEESPPDFEQFLQGEEVLAAGLAAPMSPEHRAVLAANRRLAERLDPEEARCIAACNLTRNLLGLPPLAIDLKLCECARDHSHDMRTLDFFDHESPVAGKTTPWDRAARFGVGASAENIFRGVHDGRQANQGWFRSPGHHKNMLGSHGRIGVGRSGSFFTQMFGR